ncbi:MAG: hypothetical protein JWN03_2838 [Nocardia sp.]|uniref:hypothetical protein n=1 Tax=Nocardia sp. TaxID=1821 RepID=UPI00262408C0|nr:hypothetical protein [Nocardia sp.]MCU1642563.1 hypothetical protein [Nocardia sp.]
MENWGNNPATFGAVGTTGAAIFAIVAIVVAWHSLRESRRQGGALQAEVRDRMRPWVGLFGFEFVRDHAGKAGLCLQLRNFGPLPARQARLCLIVEPHEGNPGEQPNPINYRESTYKVLIPEEDGNYRISLAQFSQLEGWIADKRDLVIKGTFEYALDERAFESQFEAKLWFSKPTPPTPGPLVEMNWRNTSAT